MSTQAKPSQQDLWRLVADDVMDRRQDKVVQSAWNIIRAYFARSDEPKLERKQLANLEDTAGETRSIALIADWVRYQMGRDTAQRTWRAELTLENKPVRFGDAVLNQIEKELKDEAESIMNQVRNQELKPDDEAEERVLIQWLLVRQFASYLEHAFVSQETEHKDRQKQPRKERRG